jgi:3-deoxy-D-manno-octulosonic-acid transferase
VAALAVQAGLVVSRRSGWERQPVQAQVWIGDSLGEMALYYGLADVALLGGSFEPLGGQNLIEAAACGCPVVMGPHTFNFAEAADLAEAAGAALRVQAMDAAVRAASELAADAPRLQAAVSACTAFAAAHRGAAQKTADAVLALLPA